MNSANHLDFVQNSRFHDGYFLSMKSLQFTTELSGDYYIFSIFNSINNLNISNLETVLTW